MALTTKYAALDRIDALARRKAAAKGAVVKNSTAKETPLERVARLAESGDARSADVILSELREAKRIADYNTQVEAHNAKVKQIQAGPPEAWLPRATQEENTRYHAQRQEQADKLAFAEAGLPYPSTERRLELLNKQKASVDSVKDAEYKKEKDAYQLAYNRWTLGGYTEGSPEYAANKAIVDKGEPKRTQTLEQRVLADRVKATQPWQSDTSPTGIVVNNINDYIQSGYADGSKEWDRDAATNAALSKIADYGGYDNATNQVFLKQANKFSQMKDEERKRFEELIQSGDNAAIKDYAVALWDALEAREAGRVGTVIDESPAGFRVGTNLIAGLGAPIGAAAGLAYALGGEELSPNSDIMAYPRIASQAAESLGNSAYEAGGGGVTGNVLKFLANTGLSMANNAVNLALGPAGLYNMAAQAAGQSTYQNIAAGMSIRDAVTLGLVSGAIEYLTEKIPFERLSAVLASLGKGAAAGAGDQIVKSALKEYFKQVGIEATEEAVSEITNTLARHVVTGEAIDVVDLAKNTAVSALGGAISGGVFGIPVARAQSQINRAARDSGQGIVGSGQETGNSGQLLVGSGQETGDGGDVALTGDAARVAREYEAAVDSDILGFVNEVLRDGGRDGGDFVSAGTLDDARANVLRQLTGVDYTGYSAVLTADALRHIQNRHGVNGAADQSMANIEDIARMKYVVENFDGAQLAGKSPRFYNSDGSKADIVLLEKRVDGHYYVAEAAPDAKSKTLYVLSAYQNKSLTGGSWVSPFAGTSDNGPVNAPAADGNLVGGEWTDALPPNVQNAPASIPVTGNSVTQGTQGTQPMPAVRAVSSQQRAQDVNANVDNVNANVNAEDVNAGVAGQSSSEWDVSADDVAELFDEYGVENVPDTQRAADIINKIQRGAELTDSDVVLLDRYPDFAEIAAEYDTGENSSQGLVVSGQETGNSGQGLVVSGQETRGARDAGTSASSVLTGQQNIGEVIQNGEQGEGARGEVFDRVGGRVPDVADGIAVENVSGEQGQDGAATAGLAADQGRDRVESLRAEERVSARSLGIVDGGAEKTVTVIPESMYTADERDVAAEVLRDTGVAVRFTLGKMRARNSAGVGVSVRGAVTPDGDMIVSADDPDASAAQIARHETFHLLDRTAKGEITRQAVERIRSLYSREEFEAVVDAYSPHYGPAYARPGVSRAEITDAIYEEIIADAYAGINAFGMNAAKYGGVAQETVNEYIERSNAPRSANVAATARTTGPPNSGQLLVGSGQETKDAGTSAQDVREEFAGTRSTPSAQSAQNAIQGVQGRGGAGDQRFSTKKDVAPTSGSRSDSDGTIKQQVQRAIPLLEGTDTLYKTGMNDMPQNSRHLRNETLSYYQSIGNKVTRPDFGEVEVGAYGVRNSLGHEPSAAKSITFRAVPAIIRDGLEIKRNVNYEGLGYRTYTFAGKIEIDGSPAYVAVVVRNTTGNNRFYVHKVYDAEGNVFTIEKQIPNYLKQGGGQGPSVPANNSASAIDVNIPAADASVNTPGENQSDSAKSEDITKENIEAHSGELQRYSIAFHGSPYRFDEFLLDHIGSGEGAQAHGWGLYFAASEQTAERYMKSRGGYDFVSAEFDAAAREAVKEFEQRIEDMDLGYMEHAPFEEGVLTLLNISINQAADYNELREYLDAVGISVPQEAFYWFEDFAEKHALTTNTFYTVDISDEDVMLHEDLPFSEQPAKVREALRAVAELDGADILRDSIQDFEDSDGERLYDAVSLFVESQDDDDYDDSTPKEKASRLLNSYGIEGIVYDGRRDGKSYVVFDDKAIKILDKASEVIRGEQRFSLSEGEIADNKRTVAAMEPVATLTGDEFRDESGTVVAKLARYFADKRSVENPDVGRIDITMSKLRGSIGHGYGEKKVAAYAALPDVLAKGVIVGGEDNHKGRGYDTVVIAAPIMVGADPNFAGAVVNRYQDGTNGYYVHEVLSESEAAAYSPTPVPASGRENNATTSTLNSLLRELWDVKRNSGAAQKLSMSEAEMERLDEAMAAEPEYALIRKFMRTTRVSFPARDKGDGSDYGFDTYNDMRKKYIGKIRLVAKGGETPEGLYGSLQSEFGKGHFPDEYTHPLEQWRRILDVLDKAYANKRILDDEDLRLWELRNAPNSSVGLDDEFVADRLEMLDGLRELAEELDRDVRANMDVAQERAKYEKRIARLKENAKERVKRVRAEDRAANKERLDKLRKKQDARIAELKEKSAAQVKKQKERIAELKSEHAAQKIRERERRGNTSKRRKIKAAIGELDALLRRPSDTKHIPQDMRAAVADFLAAMNLDNPNMANENSSQMVKDRLDARRLSLDKLKSLYEKMAKDGDTALYLDTDLLNKMEALKEVMETKPVNLLNGNELGDLYDVTRGVLGSVKFYNRMFAAGKKLTVSGMAGEVMRDNYGAAKVKPFTPSALGLLRTLGEFTNEDLLDSFHMFKELGPAMYELFLELREGMNIKIRDTVWAQSAVREALRDVDRKELKEWREKSRVYKMSGGDSIRLTDANLMSLFMQSRQDQALNHYFGGGITLTPKTVKGENGKLTVQHTQRPVKLTPQDLGNMLEQLGGKQRTTAERLSELFERTAAWGNEISMDMWGYEKFTESPYFPIVSDSNFVSDTHADLGSRGGAKLINLGETKSRVAGANNPVVVEDIFDVITRQIDHMSSYHAFASRLADMERVMNYRLTDVSVKNAIDNHLGKGAVRYIEKFIMDVNGGLKADSGGLYGRVVRSTKAAALGANIRVIIQQPTAYLRAAAMIDPKYLALGVKSVGGSRSNWDTVLKYSPISAWRDNGNYSLDTSQQMKDIIMGKHSLTEKAMWGIGKADQITWKKLWNAVEHETAAKRGDLKAGSTAFYEAVGKRFDDIVDNTQVVDTVFHRSQIMRSNNPLVKSATAFMSEGIKTYNMLFDAVKHADERGGKGRAARVFASVLASQLLGSIVRSAWDAWRDKEEDDEDDSKFLRYLFGTKEKLFLDSDLAENAFGMLPYMRDLLSLFQGYGLSSMQGDALERAYNSIAGLVTSAIKGEESKTTPWFYMKQAAGAVSALFGLPVKNAIRELEDLGRHALALKDMPMFEYQLQKAYHTVSGSPGDFYKILFSVSQYGDRPDAQAYADIEAALIKDGRTQQQIDAALRAWVLKQKGNAAETESSIESLTSEVSGYAAYKLLTQEMRDTLDGEITETARGLTLDENTDIDVNGTAAAVIRAREAGIPEAAYLLYAQVRKLYDEPPGESGYGSYSNAEIADAIEAMSDLTDEQKSALWVLSHSGEGTPLNTKLREAGVSVKSANAMTATLARLEPLSGHKAVTDGQKYEAVLLGNYSATEKRGAMKALVPVENGKQVAYDKYVAATKSGLSVRSYLTFRENNVALNNYLEYHDNGASRDGAEKMARSVMALKKLDDRDDIQDLQKYAAIVDSGVPTADQLAGFKSHMSESEYFKMDAATDYGVTPEIWVQYKGLVFDIDANGGSPKQEEATAAIRAIPGLSNTQRAALWQIQNRAWSPGNNPFGNTRALRALLDTAPKDVVVKGTNPVTGKKSA
jgi:hypothetical protein